MQPSDKDHGGALSRESGLDEVLRQLDEAQHRVDDLQRGMMRSHRLATLGTLASVVAHEYNNILTPVISYAQLALGRPEDQDLLIKAVERALQGAERAARISTSMLDFARDSEGPEYASLPEAVEEALQCMAREPAKDGIELELDLPRVRVAIPALALQQVLINLMLNARKAMKRRGGRLRVAATQRGRWVRLTVSDTGPGIPESVRDRLFEAFVTEPIGEDAGPGSAQKHSGTGLGLSICKQLVEDAGGTIRVESQTGEGASFHIDLERVAEAAEAA